MLSILLFTCAAPVPPPPKQLTTEALVGLWDYKYGSQEEGLMELQSNGIYFSRHSPTSAVYYWGVWWVRGNTLYLIESSYFPESFERKWSGNFNQYQFRFDLKCRWKLDGKTAFEVPVRLSNRREPERDWLPPLWDTDN